MAGSRDVVDLIEKDHREIERLAAMDADDPGDESVLRELVDSVGHHVEEEENTVLPACGSVSATSAGPSWAKEAVMRNLRRWGAVAASHDHQPFEL